MGHHWISQQKPDVPIRLITKYDTLCGFVTMEGKPAVQPEWAVRLTDYPWYLRAWNWLWSRVVTRFS